MFDKVDRGFRSEVFLLVGHTDVLLFDLTDGLNLVTSNSTDSRAIGHAGVGECVVGSVVSFGVVPKSDELSALLPKQAGGYAHVPSSELMSLRNIRIDAHRTRAEHGQ